MRSAAGGSSGDGGVDVKMLAEQNVQLKEALKRLHSHSIAEKTTVSAHVWTRVLPILTKCSAEYFKTCTMRVFGTTARRFHWTLTRQTTGFLRNIPRACPIPTQRINPGSSRQWGNAIIQPAILPPSLLAVLLDLVLTPRFATRSSRRLFDHLRRR